MVNSWIFYVYLKILHYELHLFAHSITRESCGKVTILVCGWYQAISSKSKCHEFFHHYDDVIMDAIASQVTSLTIVYSTVYSRADYRKHQSSASLAIVRVIHQGPVISPHKWPVTRKMFPFDDVIMLCFLCGQYFLPAVYITLTYNSSMQEWIMQGLQHKLQKSCLRCKKNSWHVESSYIVNRVRYINNVTKIGVPYLWI